MLLKKFFATCSFSLLFSACLHPQKPIVEACVADYFAQEAICGLSGQGAATTIERQPIHYLDKATCFKPPEWKKYKDYVDLLEAYALELEKNCK